MNRAVLLLLLLAAALLPILAAAQADLSQYRDKNRVLLIFAPSRTDSRWQKQNALLQHSASAFQDRELVRLDELETEGKHGAALRTYYSIKPGEFRILLIGKDGHVASSGPAPVSLESLTAQIDRMPMRREEMRRKN